LANSIVNRIKQRQPKTWKPRDFEGKVMTYMRFEDVYIDEGQWLILASTNYLLDPVYNHLKASGILFERSGVPSLSPQIAQSVVDWERLRKGLHIPYEAVKNLYRYLDTNLVQKGFKTFKSGDPAGTYSLADLKAHHGLLDSPVWHEALTKIADDKRDYLIALLRRGTRLSEPPRIKLSTIHGAKGGEADNVLLLMDLSPKFAKEYAIDADNIHRLFYVGVTRAKQALHLVMPKHIDKGFRL
jgi:hypothetical protein